jgi:hypothetical protein
MLLPNNDAIFKMTPLIQTVISVQSWCKEHEDALEHLPWLAKSPDLNNIEPMCRVIGSRMRSRLPPPSSFQELEDFLREDLCNTPLETIQNLHESISRSIKAVLQENCGPPP